MLQWDMLSHVLEGAAVSGAWKDEQLKTFVSPLFYVLWKSAAHIGFTIVHSVKRYLHPLKESENGSESSILIHVALRKCNECSDVPDSITLSSTQAKLKGEDSLFI